MSARAVPAWLPFVCVGVGATLGTGVRAGAEHFWPVAAGTWPWTTLVINCMGALLLGALQEWLARGAPAAWRNLVKVGVGTGVLGGFTTYSTLVMEAIQSARVSAVLVGLGYLVVSVILGVVFARVGLVLGSGRRRGPGAGGARPAGGTGPGDGVGPHGGEAE